MRQFDALSCTVARLNMNQTLSKHGEEDIGSYLHPCARDTAMSAPSLFNRLAVKKRNNHRGSYFTNNAITGKHFIAASIRLLRPLFHCSVDIVAAQPRSVILAENK